MTRTALDHSRGMAADWRSLAACAQFPNNLFFPGSEASDRAAERATAICAICVVRGDCLEYALETNQRAGIWGGTTEDERRSLRRKWLASRRRTG